MDYNEYYVEWHVHDRLRNARAIARREAMIAPRAPIMRPALSACAGALRALYVRWSSATSTGSKPTTARA